MKKLILLCLCMLLCATCAFAEGAMMVTGSTADRVHLRAAPSASSDSLGLYFTGTIAIARISAEEEWVKVSIGAEHGYIRSDLLTDVSGMERVACQWRKASATPASPGGWVNLRCEPALDAPVLRLLYAGDEVLMMGETVTGWSYVTDGDAYGYVMSDYLDVSGKIWPGSQGVQVMPEDMPAQFALSSGAGAWGVSMSVLPDGSFWGVYHDSDMGDSGPGYPNGTRYASAFTGHFAHVERADEWSYTMVVSDVQVLGQEDGVYYEDGVRVVASGPAGLAVNDSLTLYRPGVPDVLAPEDYRLWMRGYASDEPRWSLYNQTQGLAWIAD